MQSAQQKILDARTLVLRVEGELDVLTKQPEPSLARVRRCAIELEAAAARLREVIVLAEYHSYGED